MQPAREVLGEDLGVRPVRGDADEIDAKLLASWLAESRDVQWDYKNIVKRKGKLERLK